MKALTLTQPWATLVAIGAKRIETRSRRIMHRGPLAIHAAKDFPDYARQFTLDPVCYERIKLGYGHWGRWNDLGFPAYPLGYVLATCNVVDCLPTESIGCLPGIFDDYPELDNPNERAFGNYAPGRWGYVLEDIKLLDRPIPAKGMQTLGWEWENIIDKKLESC